MEKIVGSADHKFFTELFRVLDQDNSGTLDKKELELALSHTSNHPEKNDFYMSLLDTDGDGGLTCNEFMYLVLISQSDIKDVENTMEIFKQVDKNGNGKLSQDELMDCLKLIHMEFPDEKFEDFFKVLDVDGSGFLNKVEFYLMIQAFRRQLGNDD